MWDVFISHASEDKETIVRPLARALSAAGLKVWYDEFTLKMGVSLLRSIDQGISKSRYGVVIVSPHFFAKKWPQRELAGLFAHENNLGQVILPVWHNITQQEVESFSPILADRFGVSTAEGLNTVIREILRVVRPEDSKDKGFKKNGNSQEKSLKTAYENLQELSKEFKWISELSEIAKSFDRALKHIFAEILKTKDRNVIFIIIWIFIGLIFIGDFLTDNFERGLYYDDGSPEHFLVVPPGKIAAVKFISSQKVQITKLELYIQGGREIQIYILDSDFTPIFSKTYNPYHGWFVVDVSSKRILVEGEFYVGFQCLNWPLDEPRLGVDTTSPHHEMSYFGAINEILLSPRSNEDYMIRTEILSKQQSSLRIFGILFIISILFVLSISIQERLMRFWNRFLESI